MFETFRREGSMAETEIPGPRGGSRLWYRPDSDLTRPVGRALAHLDLHLKDHGFLRGVWSNLYQVAPGVWRSNQPSPRRLAGWQALGIRTVLNLRGQSTASHYRLSEAACARAGITLVPLNLSGRVLRPAATYLELLDAFERIEGPFLMHCKSGADRTGLASAFYLLHCAGADIAEARRMLSLRFVHLRGTKAGVLDALLDAYGRARAASGIGLRDWLATHYDPEEITAGFRPRYGRG